MDISNMRRDFESDGLTFSALSRNPLQQFENWFGDARDAGILEPNALSLATVDPDGYAALRTVLLKFFDEQGFVFYTNYDSRKARDLSVNSSAAMLFPWIGLNRQVIIRGDVEKVSEAESLRYFASRPRSSQVGAWVSEQSQVIESREALEKKREQTEARFQTGDVPLPPFWGGYRLHPNRFEFWQGRPSRLHDRFEYRLESDQWIIRRLQP